MSYDFNLKTENNHLIIGNIDANKLAEEYHDFDTLVELSINDEEKQHHYIGKFPFNGPSHVK